MSTGLLICIFIIGSLKISFAENNELITYFNQEYTLEKLDQFGNKTGQTAQVKVKLKSENTEKVSHLALQKKCHILHCE